MPKKVKTFSKIKEKGIDKYIANSFIPVIKVIDNLLKLGFLLHCDKVLIGIDIGIFETEVLDILKMTINLTETNGLLTSEEIIKHLIKGIKKLDSSMIDNPSGDFRFSISILPIEAKGVQNSIKYLVWSIGLNIVFNKNNWQILIFELDSSNQINLDKKSFDSESNLIFYITNPNEDYKEAIKQPLRELSEFLKKKLS